MGFDFEVLSNNLVSIITIPDFVKKENLSEILLWIIYDINSWNTIKSKTLEEIKNKVFAYTACRSAIKFWHKLNLFEMNKLLNESVEWYSSTCPHWRPVIFDISLNELKDKYER
jgi:DNA mismatch repair protein MutL